MNTRACGRHARTSASTKPSTVTLASAGIFATACGRPVRIRFGALNRLCATRKPARAHERPTERERFRRDRNSINSETIQRYDEDNDRCTMLSECRERHNTCEGRLTKRKTFLREGRLGSKRAQNIYSMQNTAPLRA